MIEWNFLVKKNILRKTRVLALLKFEFARSGVRKLFANCPATVMLESCPSLAVWIVERVTKKRREREGSSAKKLTHVRSDEYPLRKHPISKVLIEQGKVLDVRTARRAVRHRLVDNQRAKHISVKWRRRIIPTILNWLVFPNVIVGTLCIEELHTLETSRWHILHVFGPSNTLGFEQIHNGGNVGWNVE